MRVTIFGSGYVGLVTGACLADAGNHVICVDIDQGKIDRLNGGDVPIHEPGLERFRHPQSSQLATGASTPISSQYYQVRVGGDAAAILGICKALIATDEQAAARSEAAVLDHQFIREHTTGFEAFAHCVRGITWDEIERRSGLRRHDLEVVADVYAHSNATIFCYGMGLTQHPAGVENVRLLCNLMLLRGSIGKPGAGICPVRGHSNIQGQRTVGISEKPELVPLDTLKALYDFEPPRDKGMNTAECCDAMLHGRVDAFLGLGGNFIRAVPDRAAMEAAWRRLKLTVQVATKLNRSHSCMVKRLFCSRASAASSATSRRAGSRLSPSRMRPAAFMRPWVTRNRRVRIFCPNRRSSPNWPR